MEGPRSRKPSVRPPGAEKDRRAVPARKRERTEEPTSMPELGYIRNDEERKSSENTPFSE